jgi:MerR, DNA binding
VAERVLGGVLTLAVLEVGGLHEDPGAGGLRPREIGELLQVADQGLCPCGHTETLLRERLAEVRAELDRLRGLEAELIRLLPTS